MKTGMFQKRVRMGLRSKNSMFLIEVKDNFFAKKKLIFSADAFLLNKLMVIYF